MSSEESAATIRWDEIKAEEVFPGITRQAISGAEGTLVRYTYHPGCVFPTHRHPESQITVIHTGEIEFEIDGQWQTLRAGEVATIPGGLSHGARVIKNEIVVTDNYFASASRGNLIFTKES